MGMEMFEDPKFGELPSSTRARSGQWGKIREALKANPRKWAHVGTSTNSSSVPTAVKRGRLGFTVGHYEAVTRKPAGMAGMVEIWMRYIGPEPSVIEKLTSGGQLVDREGKAKTIASLPLLCGNCGHGKNRHTDGGCGRAGCACTEDWSEAV